VRGVRLPYTLCFRIVAGADTRAAVGACDGRSLLSSCTGRQCWSLQTLGACMLWQEGRHPRRVNGCR
jgi:hypothetical protein